MLHIEPHKTVFQVPVQTIVNTVNCEGFMGKGLALEVKRRFPTVFEKYQMLCKKGQMKIGKLQLVKGRGQWVLNFPTKNHWRGKSRMSFVEAGLRNFKLTYRQRGITSIAFPPLGCGSGGLQWDEVRPLMNDYLEKLSGIDIYICLGTPGVRRIDKEQGLDASRSAVIGAES
jgi:O-acetyl-ADP-ribose deacetylase (regulator of RNase III)